MNKELLATGMVNPQQFRKSISKSPLIAGNHHFFQCFIPVNAVDCVKGLKIAGEICIYLPRRGKNDN